MPIRAPKTLRTNAIPVLNRAKAKGLNLAAETLPRIAEAAEKAGKSVAEASNAAGEAASRKLNALTPSTASRVAAMVAASGAVGPMWRFVKRRPILMMVGGFAIARAGTMIWRSALEQKLDQAKA